MTTTPENPYEYRTHPARLQGRFSISRLNLATSFVWLSYTAVPEPTKAYLNCSDTVVNLTSILFFVADVIMAPVSGWMVEERGVKKTLLFGGLLHIFDAWIRFYADFVDSTPESPSSRVALTLVGQIIASGAQSFFFPSLPLVGSRSMNAQPPPCLALSLTPFRLLLPSW